MDITREQFLAWRDHPATKEVFAKVRLLIDEGKETMAEGGFFDPENASNTQAMTARAFGKIEGLECLLNITHSDIPAEGEYNPLEDDAVDGMDFENEEPTP